MKLNSLLALAFGAALASVEAAPLRLIVVTNAGGSQVQGLSQKIRLGHAASNPANGFPGGPVMTTITETHPVGGSKRPCLMRKVALKAAKITNSFRKALGLPLLETPNHPEHHKDHNNSEPTYSILPFLGTPPTFVEVKNQGKGGITTFTQGGDPVRIVRPDGAEIIHNPDGSVVAKYPDGSVTLLRPPHPHPSHRRHRPCHKPPFFVRLNHALMSIGKWEGRAMAFVLGCGLGVLLRMIWVLSVVGFRAIKGNNKDEEVEYTIIHEYIDEPGTVALPPTYVPVDEKADAKKDDEGGSA